MLLRFINRSRLLRRAKRHTDANRLLTLGTVDIDVSVHSARGERVVRKPCMDDPSRFLFRRWPEAEGVVSHFCLIKYHSGEKCAQRVWTYHQIDGVVLEIP